MNWFTKRGRKEGGIEDAGKKDHIVRLKLMERNKSGSCNLWVVRKREREENKKKKEGIEKGRGKKIERESVC